MTSNFESYLDTKILLQILRSSGLMESMQVGLGSKYVEEYISIVAVAKIRSLAVQFCLGDIRDCARGRS
jgi:hypothetical protein